MATFTISRHELNSILNQMSAFVNKFPKIKAKEIMLEISFDKTKLKMKVPECTLETQCVSTDKGKFSIQFLYFNGMIKLTEDEMITISIENNQMTIFQKNFKIIP